MFQREEEMSEERVVEGPGTKIGAGARAKAVGRVEVEVERGGRACRRRWR